MPITISGELVALISFEIRLGSKNFGLINLCFPYPVLETVLQKLTPQYIFQHTNVVSNEIGRNEILNKIGFAWPEITEDYIVKYLDYLKDINYLKDFEK